MKSGPDDKSDIELMVKIALRDLDSYTRSSRFQDDWTIAKQRRKGMIDRENQQGIKGIIPGVPVFPWWRSLAAAGVLILVLVIIPTRLDRNGPSLPVELVEQSVPEIIVDPNRPWTSPTDDLLRVEIRRYETQYVKFANYDPITMEIR